MSQTVPALSICLVSDDPLVASAVRIACPPPHAIQHFTMDDIVNAQNMLSTHGEAVVQAAATADVVLVEWRLDRAPIINTLCFHIRRRMLAPVVGLCRGGPEECVAAVAAGTDDTASFPLHVGLLRARALSYHRLTQATLTALPPDGTPPPGTPTGHDVRSFGVLRLDLTAHRFFIGDAEVELTPREFSLLRFLIDHAETLCTRDQILDHVWGINFDTGTNMVDVYMYFLRRKLEAHDVTGMIQTVRGRGYRLVLPPEATDAPTDAI